MYPPKGITEEQVRFAAERWKSGEFLAAIAREYGCSRTNLLQRIRKLVGEETYEWGRKARSAASIVGTKKLERFSSYTKEDADRIFNEYELSGLTIESFGKKIGICRINLTKLFNKYLPERFKKLKSKKIKDHNEKFSKYTEADVLELIDQWRGSHLPLHVFSKDVKIGKNTLSKLFKKFLPAEYEAFTEINIGRGSNKYKKGRAFEYLVRDHFKQKGYFVLRSPRSRGLADLIAIKKGELLFIQCKLWGGMNRNEQKDLFELAESVGAKAMLASKSKWRSRELKIIELEKS